MLRREMSGSAEPSAPASRRYVRFSGFSWDAGGGDLKVPWCWSRSKSAIRVIRVWTRRVRVRVCRGRIGRTGNGTADDGTRCDASGDAAPTAPVVSASVATTADVDVAVDVDVDVAAVHIGAVV